MTKRKKDSNRDYPLLGYRVLPGIKKKVIAMLEKTVKAYNRELDELEKPYKKNEIFVEALEKGLNEMLRKKGL